MPNDPEVMRIHDMRCEVLYCTRKIKFRIRQVKRQLRDWLGEEFQEFAHERQTRPKRGIIGNVASKVATKLIGKITLENFAGLVVDGMGSWNWKKDRAIKKGIETLQNRQEELKGKIIRLNDELLSVATTTTEVIRDIYVKMIKGNAKIAGLSKQFNHIKSQFIEHDKRLIDHEHALKILA